jgi:hypothetical protein
MDGGRIVELVTHQQLLGLDGLYARLYSMQFRDPADASAGTATTPNLERHERGLLTGRGERRDKPAWDNDRAVVQQA